MRVLYVTHYGILEPLGQSQILPYLIGLAARGHSLEIISFEKENLFSARNRVDEQSRVLTSAGIRWHPRPYHRGESLRFLLADIARTGFEIQRRCSGDRIDLLHCRTHVPYMTAWPASILWRKPVLFDFRGFVAEEYVDSGLWKANGPRVRITKALERRMARQCAALVVLTKPAGDYLIETCGLDRKKVFVIPCCVDLKKFRSDRPARPVEPGRPLKVVYAGSTIGRYKMPEMLRFFDLLQRSRPGSHFTILSSGDPSAVRVQVEQSGLPRDTVTLCSLSPEEVPERLAQQDLGLIFMHGNLGLIGTSPTKLGEYLACGLTVIAEQGIGGLKEVLVDTGVGCLVDSQRPPTWPAAVAAALRLCDQTDMRKRAVEVATRYYALTDGINGYREAYEHAVARFAKRSVSS